MPPIRYLLVVFLCVVSSLADLSNKKPNVLYLVIDDLRAELGAYGSSIVHTPNIDRLASHGVTFDRAYCQQAYCSPSRNSFLSGRRPDTTKTWNFINHFRQAGEFTSLPELFEKQGYVTYGTGKIYHAGRPPKNDPRSWTDNNIQFPKKNKREYVIADEDSCSDSKGYNKGKKWLPKWSNISAPFYCGVEASKQGRGAWFPDVDTTDDALHKMRDAAKRGRPFFLGVGFRKPHLPWRVPKPFLERYSGPGATPLPAFGYLDKSVPLIAFHSPYDSWKEKPLWTKHLKYGGPYKKMPDWSVKLFRTHYYATIDYLDTMVGKVLSELQRLKLDDNTIVVLHSDHGWSLGDRNQWKKQNNWEETARVPLIVSVPWLKQSHGQHSAGIVELVDVYRTLADLTNLHLPKRDSKPVEGKSFAGLLRNTRSKSKPFAITQHPRCPEKRGEVWENNICTHVPSRKFRFMGYSIRTADWRYTEWPQWNGKKLRPVWSSVDRDKIELYDHRGDNGARVATEQVNVAAKFPKIVAQLRKMLRSSI